MKVKDFFGLIKKQGLSALNGAYLVHGEEEYSKEKIYELLIEQMNPAFKEFNIILLDNPQQDQIILACEGLPLMEEKKLVIIRNSILFNGASAQVSQIIEYFKSLPSTTVCVFIQREKCDSRKTFFRSFNKSNIVDCEIYSERDAMSFAISQAAKQQVTLPRELAAKLISMVGKELIILEQEVAKICMYVYDTKVVDSDVLEDCVSANLEYSVFKILDLLNRGELKSAINMLHLYVKDEGSGAVHRILAFFSNRFSLMLKIKYCIESKLDLKMLEKEFNINSYTLQTAKKESDRFSIEQIENAIEQFSQADIDFKTGKKEDMLALELALIKIFD